MGKPGSLITTDLVALRGRQGPMAGTRFQWKWKGPRKGAKRSDRARGLPRTCRFRAEISSKISKYGITYTMVSTLEGIDEFIVRSISVVCCFYVEARGQKWLTYRIRSLRRKGQFLEIATLLLVSMLHCLIRNSAAARLATQPA